MTILSINECNQLLPINQIIPINPGSYNDFVATNKLDPNRDNLLKYSRELSTYRAGYIAMLNTCNISPNILLP